MASRADEAGRLDPLIVQDLHLLEGITSIGDALQDPEQAPRILAFMHLEDGEPPADVPWRDVPIPGAADGVAVRIYEPDRAAGGLRPVLVWVHGGGFEIGSVGDAPTHRGCALLAAASGATVVSVEYRLAVEGRHYPVPLDDVVAAVRWVRASLEQLRGDPDRVSIGGDSAGGNLAAGATLRLRDEDGWIPAALITVYPIVHPVLPPHSPELTASLVGVPDLLRFLPEDVRRMNRNYLGGPETRADGYAMPGLADLRGLPPVLIIDAECDDLRASGEAFAASLIHAGVDVRHVVARGMLHGFLISDRFAQARFARALLADTIAAARADRGVLA